MCITLENWTDGVVVGSYKIENLCYTDDTTLFARSFYQIEELLQKMKEHVILEYGLQITKMMGVSC